MAVVGRLAVDRAAKAEGLNDRGGAKVEHRVDGFGQLFVGNLARAERV